MRLPALRRGIVALTGVPLTVALFVAWFLFFRPITLGGTAGYVIVSGHSMEPAFLTGDLAITQHQDDYAVGDIVAFATDGGIVIHRIVGGNAEQGFTTQGDNKDLPDLWHPRAGNVVGKVWLHLPQVGTVLALVRQPAYLGALAAAMAFFLAFSAGRSGRPGTESARIDRQWPFNARGTR